MKKIVLIALVLFLGVGVSAQTVGLRFGYNMSGLRIDDNFADYLEMMDINGKLTNGVNIGLVLERPINPKVDMHIELNLLKKDLLSICMLTKQIMEHQVMVKPI